MSQEKQLKLIVTFPTTTEAICMEKACRNGGLPGRLIPVPRAISASCGMAWCAPTEAREILEQMVQAQGITAEGWYYVMI